MVLGINLSNLVVFAISLLVFCAVLYDALRIRFRNRRLFSQVIQAELDKAIYENQLKTLVAERDLKGVEQTDGFLKFVSDSRDWAFKYIEDIQEAIEELREAIDSDDAEADVEKAYEKVISFLPDKLEG